MTIVPIGGAQASATETDDAISRNRGIKSIQTPLFDNAHLNEEDAPKLNSLIRKNFRGVLTDIPEALKPFASRVALADMLDFDTTTFDKQIKTSAAGKIEIMVRSKYPFEMLGEIAPYVKERVSYSTIDADSYISTDNMLQDCQGVKAYDGNPNVESVVKYKRHDILVSNIRPYLRKLWLADKEGGCSPDVLVFRIADKSKVDVRYLRYVLSQDAFFDFMMAGRKGVKMPRGDKNMIPRYKVPIPPMPVQKKIVVECEKVDDEYNNSRMAIEEYRAKISKLFSGMKILISDGGGVQT